MEYKNVRSGQVILDPENPRLPDGTSSDKEAINRLLDDGFEQLVALARDLVDMGAANPAELPILVRSGGKYLVLEGNRRFAALRLLADPKLANLGEHQAAFRRLAERGKAPTTVYSCVAASREEADHWIMLRHTGANNGVSTKRWSAEQTATHRRRMRAAVDAGTLKSITIADELTETYQLDEALVDAIARVRTAKLTNIGRFFSTDVLTRLHFAIQHFPGAGVQERILLTRHDADQLHEFFAWAFDYIDTHSVDAYKNPSTRAQLLDTVPQLIPAFSDAHPELLRIADLPYGLTSRDDLASSADPTPAPADDERDSGSGPGSSGEAAQEGSKTEGEANTQGTEEPQGQKRPRDTPPERYLYSGVKLSSLPVPVQRLLKEAKTVVMEEKPYTACILARVTLELTVSSPGVLAWSGAQEKDSLASKIRAALRKLDPELGQRPQKVNRRDLMQAQLETEGIGVQYMHQFVHNSMSTADHHLARRFSAAFSPLLNAINDTLAGRP